MVSTLVIWWSISYIEYWASQSLFHNIIVLVLSTILAICVLLWASNSFANLSSRTLLVWCNTFISPCYSTTWSWSLYLNLLILSKLSCKISPSNNYTFFLAICCFCDFISSCNIWVCLMLFSNWQFLQPFFKDQ